MSQQKAYPPPLQQREQQWIALRRNAQETADARDTPPGAANAGAVQVGLALSGGGIRSATFCLGVVQGLAKHRLLRRVDYLSTVSGGGYLGSFLGGLYARSYVQDPADVERLLHPEGDGPKASPVLAASPPIKPFKALRNNGNYLAPGGGGDVLGALASAVRNWAALHLVPRVNGR